MSELRQRCYTSMYGQMNPLVIYQKEGLNLLKIYQTIFQKILQNMF